MNRVKRLPTLNARERNQLRNDLSNPMYVKRSEVWKQFYREEITADERDKLLIKYKDT